MPFSHCSSPRLVLVCCEYCVYTSQLALAAVSGFWVKELLLELSPGFLEKHLIAAVIYLHTNAFSCLPSRIILTFINLRTVKL